VGQLLWPYWLENLQTEEGICDAYFHSCHKNMISMRFTVGRTCWALGTRQLPLPDRWLCFLNILRASIHQGNWRPQCNCNFEVSHVLRRKSVAQLASAHGGCD